MEPTPRPTDYDQDIIKEGVRASLGIIKDYLRDEYVEDQEIKIFQDLLQHERDGYILARQLESAGWFEDRELVSLCDDIVDNVYKAARLAVKEWLAAFKIEPKYEEGQLVSVVRNKKTYVGSIEGIDRERGTYTVRVKSEGHGRHCGWVIAWELPTAEPDIS